MARDAVAITSLTKNTAATTPVGTAISPTNGANIPAAGNFRKLLIRITNTNGSDRIATIKAGVQPPAMQNAMGDLAITVPATTGDVLVAIESARFCQADGSINVDFGASMAGKISAIRLPNNV